VLCEFTQSILFTVVSGFQELLERKVNTEEGSRTGRNLAKGKALTNEE
jgi:hypothetical protein